MAQVNANGARLISIDPYVSGGVVRYAAVMVPNTGAQARGWWVYWGLDSASILSVANSLNARPTTIRPYWNGSATVYTVLYVQNTGRDYRSWRYYTNSTLSGIGNEVTNQGLRVVSLAREPNGTFD